MDDEALAATGAAGRTLVRAKRRLRDWCAARPRLCFGLALILAVASVLCLQWAVRQRSLPRALLIMVLGGALGAGALLLVNELWVRLINTLGRARDGVRAGLALIALGAATTAIAIRWTNGPATAAGLVVVLVGLLAIDVWLSGNAVRGPQVWVGGGLAATLVGPILLTRGAGWALIGVAVWVLGLAAFKTGVLPLVDRIPAALGQTAQAEARSRRAAIVVGLGVLATIVGFVLVRYGASDERPQVMGFGLLISLVGLSGAGLAATRLETSRLIWALVGFAGIVLIGAGGWLVVDVIGDWLSLIVVICATLAALGAWFVFRGEGLVFVVLLGFVLVWALDDRNNAELAELPVGTPGVVALGDSFISGEGANNFIAGTNTPEPDGNTCRRAATAYPALVAAAPDADLKLHSFACQAAKIADLTTDEQMENTGSPIAGWLPQLANLTHEDPRFIHPDDLAAVEVVLVSIGGNDTGFSRIIISCLLPSNCAENEDAWIAKAESLEDELVVTYQAIDDATGDAAVVVVPYPHYIEDRDCNRVVSGAEYSFVVRFLDALNNTIYRAARRAEVLVADTRTVFEGHQQCDDEPAANLIVLAPTAGSIVDRLNPANWVHGSMHPWELGHELQAEVLGPLVGDLVAGNEPGDRVIDLDAIDATPTDTPDNDRLELIDTADELLETDSRWTTEQLYDTAAKISWPVAFLLIGGLVLALGSARFGLAIAVFLAPEDPA